MDRLLRGCDSCGGDHGAAEISRHRRRIDPWRYTENRARDDDRGASLGGNPRVGKLRSFDNGLRHSTDGFDLCVRPTKSPGLWLQMLGRGMRLSPGKTDCLVCDFAGNIRPLGPATEIDGESAAGVEPKAKSAHSARNLWHFRQNCVPRAGARNVQRRRERRTKSAWTARLRTARFC